MKTILHIHGYGSDGKPRVVDYLRKYLDNAEYEILSPKLDEKPSLALSVLREIVETRDIALIIASSYGAYFALLLMNKVNIPLILINPCLNPIVELPKIGNVSAEFMKDLEHYDNSLYRFCDYPHSYLIHGVFGTNDELINYQDEYRHSINDNLTLTADEHSLSEQSVKETLIPLLLELIKKREERIEDYKYLEVEDKALIVKNKSLIDSVISRLNNQGDNIALEDIPLDDKATLDCFLNDKVQNLNKLYDLELIELAKYRVFFEEEEWDYLYACINGGVVNNELDLDVFNKHTQHTYGRLLYQEQREAILYDITGFPEQRLYQIKKAFDRNDKEILEGDKQDFLIKGLENNYKREDLEQLWTLFDTKGMYLFSYEYVKIRSLIAYQMAFLKVHYSTVFMELYKD